MNAGQDAWARLLSALEQRNTRRVIVGAELSVQRSRELLESSRSLLVAERQLLAEWRARKPWVYARLKRRPNNLATALLKLPKAA